MKKIITSLCVAFATLSVVAQNRQLSTLEAAYQAIQDPSSPIGYRLLTPENLQELQWIQDTNQYLYNHDDVYEIFNAQGEKVTSLPTALTNGGDLIYSSKDLFVIKKKNNYLRYSLPDHKPLPAIELPQDAENAEYDPASQTVAYTLNNNLYIATEKETKRPITAFTQHSIVAGKAIHRNEFGIQKGTFFSPKGAFLAFYQKDESLVADYPLVDINNTPATLKAIKYPMAGQPSERAAVGVYQIATNKLIYLDINTSDEHFLTNLAWSPDEKYILLAEVNRAQNHFALNRYEVATGKKVNTIFEERNPKWVEPELPAVFLPNNPNEFLWLSERDGFMNVYHYNVNGKLIKQLTHFRWVVQEILGFDAQAKNLFIVGTGADPREKHCYKIDLKNPKKITPLTTEAGTHQVQLSTDGQYLIDSYSNVSLPRKIVLTNTHKGTQHTLLNAQNPLEGIDVATTELLTLKADDGTTLYAKLHKPANFNPQKKYPVLIYVYGGPHAQQVVNKWGAGTYLWLKAFAQNEQYIVFTIDNRGSENRGFAFESVIHRHLGDIEIKDQLKGVEYLKSLPYVDANRIAVHGWSFGGFMASSLLTRHPEIFKTAVAGGAVTDWKYYEVMYGERYMDTPAENPEGYENSRVAKYLPKLQRPLLFIHGSVDDVVVPQHLMSIAQESIKNNNLIEMFIYPMHAHGVGYPDYLNLTERIIDYIKKHNNP